MAVETNWVDISRDNFVNIYDDICSHVAIMIAFTQKVDIILGGNPPTSQNEKFFTVSAGSDEFSGSRLVMSFDNLEDGDAIWVRAASDHDLITVVRGNVEIRGNR